MIMKEYVSKALKAIYDHAPISFGAIARKADLTLDMTYHALKKLEQKKLIYCFNAFTQVSGWQIKETYRNQVRLYIHPESRFSVAACMSCNKLVKWYPHAPYWENTNTTLCKECADAPITPPPTVLP